MCTECVGKDGHKKCQSKKKFDQELKGKKKIDFIQKSPHEKTFYY